jgi:thiamine biosynthesis lipoprotein
MTVHHETVMGTVASIEVPEQPWPTAAVDRAIAWLHDVDGRFSRFQPDSEMSRMATGRLQEVDAHPDIRDVLAIADALTQDSGGAFDARRWDPAGVDPTGIVKGWAVQRAADLLIEAGVRRFAIGVGGDLVVRAGEGPPWRIGIRHPDQADKVTAIVALRDGAMATSATYERGQHIVDPRDGRPATGVRSVTIVGPDLTYADAYATAAFVLGAEGLPWIERHRGYAGYTIGCDDRCRWTTLMDRYLLDEPAAGSGAAA